MREKRRNREWTEQELEILQEHYKDTPADEITALLPGRTVPAINNKAQKLGLAKLAPIDQWREPENLERLKQAFAEIGTVTEVARKIGVGESTLGMWMARYIDISQAVEAGRAQYRARRKPRTHKRKAKAKSKLAAKPKAAEPEGKCATCYSWARRGADGELSPCLFPCMREEGEP